MTADSPLPSAERLRRLAIVFDEEVACGYPPERRWAALAPVYDEALRLDPDSEAIWHSRAISALEVAEAATLGSEARSRFWKHALHAARAAAAHAPEDGDTHYTLGRVHYWADPPQHQDALAEFREASRLTPTNQWARLYEAHCLHDLHLWEDAVRAYGEVRLDAFDGPSGWRRELLLEQRSYCLARAGRRAEALEGFLQVVARREAALARNEDFLTSDALFVPPYLLAEVAESILPELAPQARELMRRFEAAHGPVDDNG